MKKTLLAFSAFFASSYALAAFPGSTDPTLINVPSLPETFILGGSLLYFQPNFTNGDLDYASFNNRVTPFVLNSSTNQILNVEPGYQWGWNVYDGYIFPDSGNDINFSFMRLEDEDTNSTLPVDNSKDDFITPIILVNGGQYTGLTDAQATYDLDQADASVGQYVDIGCRTRLHAFSGVRWMDLDRELQYGFTDTNFPNEFLGVQEKSQYEGIGPLVGLDGSYYLGYGFGIVAHTDAALLVGDIKANVNTNFTSSSNAHENFSVNEDSKQQLVPVWDAKLGADYTYIFNQNSISSLTLEIGYQASHYYNAVEKLYTDRTPPASADNKFGLFQSSFITQRSTSDLGLNGPYASLTLRV